ncbi:MAG: hypothetical protein SVX43_22460 [Cyanobacteriota bacterium]|nr:hypothetical protein [Cyanobacteriota bacterium]
MTEFVATRATILVQLLGYREKIKMNSILSQGTRSLKKEKMVRDRAIRDIEN